MHSWKKVTTDQRENVQLIDHSPPLLPWKRGTWILRVRAHTRTHLYPPVVQMSFPAEPCC